MVERENMIKDLLSLKAFIEREYVQDEEKIRRLQELNAQRRRWLQHLDEILSEASFRPASDLIKDIPVMIQSNPAVTGREQPERAGPPRKPEKMDRSTVGEMDAPRPASLSAGEHGPANPAVGQAKSAVNTSVEEDMANVASDDGTILATIHFFQETIIITFNENFKIFPADITFKDHFQKRILSQFEQQGCRVYMERGKDGEVRSVTIIGSFEDLIKERLVDTITKALGEIHVKKPK